jgi:methenyltetrahydrofolate cyclohydrolase
MTSDGVSIAGSTVVTWLERLAEPVPDPGGGAAAGLVLATGAALAGMAAGYVADPVEREPLVRAAGGARRAMLAAADADAEVSAALAGAYRLPADDPERPARIRSTMLAAAASARDLALLAAPLVPALERTRSIGAATLLPDAAVAAELLAAGVRGCAATVRADVSAAESAGEPEATVTWWRAEECRLAALADDLLALARRMTDDL